MEAKGFPGTAALGLVTSARAQNPDARLSQAEFVLLAGRCAPVAPADTLLAIASTESGLHANAISINRPNAAARRAGYSNGELVLKRQPKDRKEAMNWLHWFVLSPCESYPPCHGTR